MILRQIKYFLKETANNLWQFRTRNFFSITIICLSFFILGIFIALSNNLKYTAQQISNNMQAVIFLMKDNSSENIDEIEKSLRESPLIHHYEFVSEEEAARKFKERFPDLQGIVSNLNTNPFPSSFEIIFHKEKASSEEIFAFLSMIKKMDGVDDVQFHQEWIERMQSFSRLAKAIGFFLGGILILASFFIISNVIKLNVYSRQEEIEILRLAGATNLFIRTPFLLEGVTLGILGATLSLGLLFLTIQIIPLYLGSSLGALNELINFRFLSFGQCLAQVISGALIGTLGSLSSISRFLKN